jgi:hypothetical protein
MPKSKLVILIVCFPCAMGLVACSSTPNQGLSEREWRLRPTNADQNLRVDEQFLRKAQEPIVDETASLRTWRRSFLHP